MGRARGSRRSAAPQLPRCRRIDDPRLSWRSSGTPRLRTRPRPWPARAPLPTKRYSAPPATTPHIQSPVPEVSQLGNTARPNAAAATARTSTAAHGTTQCPPATIPQRQSPMPEASQLGNAAPPDVAAATPRTNTAAHGTTQSPPATMPQRQYPMPEASQRTKEAAVPIARTKSAASPRHPAPHHPRRRRTARPRLRCLSFGRRSPDKAAPTSTPSARHARTWQRPKICVDPGRRGSDGGRWFGRSAAALWHRAAPLHSLCGLGGTWHRAVPLHSLCGVGGTWHHRRAATRSGPPQTPAAAVGGTSPSSRPAPCTPSPHPAPDAARPAEATG